MKKFFAVLALVGVLASCKDKKKDEKKMDETTTNTPVTTEPTTTMDVAPTMNGETPKFKDADVQAYADSYAAYAEAYKKAADSKDMSKFSDLSKMGQDLSTKAAAMTQKLMNSPEEAQKLSDFIVAKTNEIAEYTKKMTGQ
ncbi:MAG: hypothetical protein H7Y01_11970 [Ferruginibacter sp.]|nr:hypothetical protein [Chitinophagaceae bacterium]